ncbi:MAG: ribosomal L7Ae/L30e/S12e/Gadd45 family protein [Clostridiales bacterium]|nr:ribosomal L7Ae/L30e/S12e/Gadd45 family protein [Eubacteriales bacterium]MDH7566423.1 ribosomal L7Ae/L30e/S12e/Gadd45 family protein [Clostridiales bacterium]
MLENLKNGNRAVGVKQCLKALENGAAMTVFIAKDAEEKVVSRLKELCAGNSIEVVYVDSMKQLGKACGIDVGAAAACLLK